MFKLKTENLKLDFPLSLRERVRPALSTVEGVRVGRLRFPHLPIHLFTGLIFFALLTAALPAWAAVPGTLSYQGKLSNSSGTPVTGTVSMAFAIYGVSTGGTALWSETQGSVNVASGIFTVTLGSVTSIPSTVFSNTDLYLGIKVGADAEMTPRQKINSVPFAIKSGTAESATSGGVPSGFMILGESSTPPAGYTYTGETTGNANQWILKTLMTTGQYMFSMVSVNNKLYSIGGEGWPEANNINEEYDPLTNTWATKQPMPTPRGSLAAAVVNNKVYAIGGANGSGLLATVEEYDPATDTWIIKASMPTARQRLAAAAVNNKIYAIGGSNYNYNSLATVEEYDPATNIWSTKTPMPTARGEVLVAVAVNSKIYVIGGYNSTPLSTVEEYDPATDTWTTKAPMAHPRSYFTATVINNSIYVFGGYGDSLSDDTTEIYDPSENSWINGPMLPENNIDEGLQAASINNKIYLMYYKFSVGNVVTELNTKTYYVHRKD